MKSMDSNRIFELRRTINEFEDKKVPKKQIIEAIEAGNLAPCHRLTFPWRFKSIKRKNRVKIAELYLEIKSQNKTLTKNIKQKLMNKIMNSSHLIVASQIKEKNKKIDLENYAACSCAIQNIMLSLASNDIGSKWSTGKVTEHRRTYEITEINPKKEKIIGFIFIGFGRIPPEIKRPKLETIYSEI